MFNKSIDAVTKKRGKKDSTVRQNAEFGLISCGLVVTKAAGTYSLTGLGIITQIMLGESFFF